MRNVKFAVLAAVAGLLAMPAIADEDINAWGKPTDWEKGDKYSVGLWKDDDGWHIRWTTAKIERHFHGYIEIPGGGEFTKIVMVHKEKEDHAKYDPKEKKLVFDTKTKEGVDGFDFRSESKKFQFHIKCDGKELEEDKIFIGHNNRHPNKNPFTLDKWEAHERKGGKDKK